MIAAATASGAYVQRDTFTLCGFPDVAHRPAVAGNHQAVAGANRVQVYHQADIFQFLRRQAVHVVLAAVQSRFLRTEGHEPQSVGECAVAEPFRDGQQRGHAGGVVRRAHRVGHGVVVGPDYDDTLP